MNLAIVSLMTGVPWGGSEELWAAAARECLQRGGQVEAVLPAWPAIPERVKSLQDRGMTLKRWRMFDPSLSSRIARRLSRGSLMRRVSRTVSDLLVVSLGSAWDLAGYPQLCEYLRLTKKRFVLVVQHNHEMPIQPWTRERIAGVYERAASLVFVSERNLRTAERQLGSPLPNAVVLQNPVNLPSLDPVPWPEGNGGEARFACVARLETGAKGQDVLFEALAAPAWCDRNWRLTLLGEGPDREYLQRLAAMYGIGNRVTFVGQSRDMRAAWSGQEMLVLPSRSEGTPLSLVEAQVAGRPAVVTDVGDSARWVAEGETGFIADAATARSLGNALQRAWDQRPSWRAMGERACESAMCRLDREPGATLLNHLMALER